MLELLLCSLFTVVPDYLYRRYAQGKRIGSEITIYSVWYELRYGITSCLMLTVLLITMIFYYHPSTTNVVSLFRAVPIVPETNGRVAEIYVKVSDEVAQGAPIFRLDSAKQEAALEVAKRNIAEIEARKITARAEIAAAQGQVQEAKGAYEAAVDELKTKQAIAHVVARREIEKLEKLVEVRLGSLDAANANMQAAETKLSTLLPAEKDSAEAAQHQAQVELNKTVVRAGIDGRVEQFVLRVGDIVNPLMRPAGLLIPSGVGGHLIAGFGQIEAQVIKPGMIAEVTCVSRPLTIIPMVVTSVQACSRPGPILRAAPRCAAGDAAGYADRFPRAALQGRPRWGDGRQQLHCQCLHQQSRAACQGRPWLLEEAILARDRHGQHRARHDLTAAGTGTANQGLDRRLSLTRRRLRDIACPCLTARKSSFRHTDFDRKPSEADRRARPER